MKSFLTAAGAGLIAVAMLTGPADAAPRCVWKGAYWQCWNGHSWYRDYHRRAETRHDWRYRHDWSGQPGRDMHYGSSSRHDWRQDRNDWRYGR
jgi:hypothetical protein